MSQNGSPLSDEPEKLEEPSAEVVDPLTELLVEHPLEETPNLPTTEERPPSEAIPDNKRDPIAHGEACSYCTNTAHTKCFACQRFFCSEHASKHDTFLCRDCADPNADELTVDTEIKPLIDEDGVKHTGKHIIPIGGTYAATSFVDTLSDEDLRAYAEEYRAKVKEAEFMLYSRLIVSGNLDQKVLERERKRRLAGRAARIAKTPEGKQVILPGPGQKPTVPKAVEAVLTPKEIFAGLMSTPEGKAKLVEVLKGLGLGKKK
jgi:hypothetical protein